MAAADCGRLRELVEVTAWQLDPGGATGPQEKVLAKKRRC